MSMRISSALFGVAALVACSAGEAQDGPPPGATVIECAIGPGAEFGPGCGMQRVGDELLVYHPDGGFRRFAIRDDGSGLEVLAGADEALNTLDGEFLQVTVGADRYRFPTRAMADGDG